MKTRIHNKLGRSTEGNRHLAHYKTEADFAIYDELRDTSLILKYGLQRRTGAAAILLNEIECQHFQLLDVGTADGKMLLSLQNTFPSASFIGLEKDKRLCQIAKESGLYVIDGDARHLPFRDASFDVVLLSATIKHVNNYQQVFSECRRVLTQYGHIIVLEPSRFAVTVGIMCGHFDPRYVPNVWSLREACKRINAEHFQVLRAFKYMLLPICIPGVNQIEAILGRTYCAGLFLHQAILARKYNKVSTEK